MGSVITMQPMLESHAWLERHGLDVRKMEAEDYFHRSFRTKTGLREYGVRWEYIRSFGFAIPNHRAIAAIAAYAPILEVGAGCGYWAAELIKAGVDVVVTDPGTGTYGHESATGWSKQHCVVEQLHGVDAINKYPDRALLMIWPDYDVAWPADVLASFYGGRFIYVGEGAGGCTGDDRFHALIEHDWQVAAEVYIPQFWGIRDYMQLFTRKPRRALLMDGEDNQ